MYICPVTFEDCVSWETNDTLKEFSWKPLNEGLVIEWRAELRKHHRMLKHQEAVTVGSPYIPQPEGRVEGMGLPESGEKLEP